MRNLIIYQKFSSKNELIKFRLIYGADLWMYVRTAPIRVPEITTVIGRGGVGILPLPLLELALAYLEIEGNLPSVNADRAISLLGALKWSKTTSHGGRR